MSKAKNIFKNQQLTRQGEIIIPEDFGAYKKEFRERYYEWFKLKGKTGFMFKSFSKYEEDMDGEILYDIMAEEVGLPAENAIPAIKLFKNGDMIKGFAVQDFVKNKKTQKALFADQVAISKDIRRKNSIQAHMDGINKLASVYKKEGKQLTFDQNIQNQLFLMGLLDFLSLNTDRHAHNISYIIEKKGENTFELKLARAYDNGYAFKFRRMSFIKKQGGAKKHAYDIRNSFKFNVGNSDYSMNWQIATQIKSNDEYKKIYEKVKKLNFDVLKLRLKEKYPNYKYSESKFEFAKNMFVQMLEVLDKDLTPQQINNSGKKVKAREITF